MESELKCKRKKKLGKAEMKNWRGRGRSRER
jgi:hypothetical protein